MNNTRSKVFSALIWTYGERITAQVVSLIVSIVLARLLLPREYGVVTLVLVFINIANVFVSDGFGNALIQKKDADHLDFSSMFWFSLAVSILLFTFIFILAPYISSFYDMSQLTMVMRVMAIKLPLASANTIQKAYISRKMEFKKFFFSTLIGTIISAVVGIALAYRGFGVWALVAQYLTNSTIDTFVLSLTSGWQPKFELSIARLRPLVSFGWRILAVGLMNALYSNLRNLIIGKKFSEEDLAYSNQGEKFPAIISVNINTSISNVLFPAISAEQSNLDRVKAMTKRAIKVGTFLLGPVLLGLAAVSYEMIEVVLTEKWLACVPYLKIMCVVYLLQPIQTAGIQAMKALGNSKLYMNLEIIKKIGGLLILSFTVIKSDSVYAIVVSALIAEIYSTLVNLPAISKLLNYSILEQLRDAGIPVVASMLMYFGVIFFRSLVVGKFNNHLILLIIEIFVGIVIYLLISKALKVDSLSYVKSTLNEVKSRKHENKEEK